MRVSHDGSRAEPRPSFIGLRKVVKLWVGLGNPEPGMARNRHNIGFMAIDRIAYHYRFSPWRQRFRGVVAEGQIGGEKILALKPLTYMNASGESVQPAAAFFKLEPGDITVFYDELDLAPGKVRVKRGGGAAGHNGLRSIDAHLPTPDYWRVRIGIGHPGDKARVLGHVLGNFPKADEDWLVALLDSLAESAPLLAAGQPEAFMSRVALLQTEN
jgi:PTH1 family peptidyl-tRNA hydrolase